MAVLKNKTQKNFTMISNSVLRDTELSMKDRGVLCTICSLPDGWEFSIAESEVYKDLIAENIKLEWLLEVAQRNGEKLPPT